MSARPEPTPQPKPFLPGYAAFAATLAAAGLPIYIHAPKFYVDSYGVGLGALGAVLFGLRLLDVVQDPALGWLVAKLRTRRGVAVATAIALMAANMIGLFAIAPPVAPLLWFALMMAGLFSAFSFLNIAMYAQGVQTADAWTVPGGGHLRIAAWRESGALIGVCVAAVAPVLLGEPGFALGFAGLCTLALVVMRDQWSSGAVQPQAASAFAGFTTVTRDLPSRRLLLIALLNAAPVAITSTLFLFYVDAVLQLPGSEGLFLILFFLSAACAAPLWSRFAARIGSRPALLMAMGLAILGFLGVSLIGAGDGTAFAVICVVTGAAVGADFAILPAAFAARMAGIGSDAAVGFGLWSLVSKAALAIAAIALLPALQIVGFNSLEPAASEAGALIALQWFYAGIPCGLKLLAMALVMRTPLPQGAPAEKSPAHID